jgi:hypothetical protein
LLGLVIIASNIFIENAKGYGYKTGNGTKIKWSGEAIKWRASKVSFPAGSSYRTALVRAISRWNQAPGEFTFTYPLTWNDTSVSKNNDQTEVWASDNLDPPAVCYKWWKWSGGTAKYREADIVFDTKVSWSTSTNLFNKDVTSVYDNEVYGGIRRPFVTTALHEMGHALGLNHENRFLNIMGSDRSHLHANDGKMRAYVGEDAGNGEVFLYGQTDNILKDDLSASHWKYWKAGGKDNEYSQHILTKIYHAGTDNIVSWEWFEGVRRYNIKKGNTYKVQFTYENNGYYDKSNVKVGFYISTNDRITTLDWLFDTRTVTLKRNVPWTKKFTLTIPNEMGIWVNQTYWLGVIVDYTGSITEFAEDNNAAYIPIKIIP